MSQALAPNPKEVAYMAIATLQEESVAATVVAEEAKLRVANPERVKQAEGLVDANDFRLSDEVEAALEAQANKYVSDLVAVNMDDFDKQDELKGGVEDMGLELQQQSAVKNKMLQAPVRELLQHSEDGGEVANALLQLQEQVEELDPNQYNLVTGWLKMFTWMPFVGKSMTRYFKQYVSAQTLINSIVQALEAGRQRLVRDNKTLEEKRKDMRVLTHKLQKTVRLGRIMDDKLATELENTIDTVKADFIRQQLLFPLRQRVMDLQQSLLVNQMGVTEVALIVDNNKELIRGVNRAKNVTVTALDVAVTVALALNHQKLVLDKITALNATTSNLIAGTAKQLRVQGAEIHNMASSAMLPMDSLKSAFSDIHAAMDDIAAFRSEALPQMKENIVEMERMSREAEERIRQREKGERAKAAFKIEVFTDEEEKAA